MNSIATLVSIRSFITKPLANLRPKGHLEQKRKNIALVLVCALLAKREAQKLLGKPFPVKRKRRKDFWKVVRKYSAEQFKKAFRLTSAQFRALEPRLKPKLDAKKSMAEISSGHVLAEVKVALFLRILAGASYHDLCLIYDIHASPAFHLFHRRLTALLETFSLPGLLEDEEGLKKLVFKFKCSRRGGGPLNGCVGAQDGIAFKIRKPSKRYHPAVYYCRKGFYAIPAQVLVDSDYCFRCFSALCVDSTHDSLSHSVSSLGRYLASGKLGRPFWIYADEAYICCESLLTPFANSQLNLSILSKYKDAYNFFQSSLRMHVEQTFGILVARFGILWRPLQFSLATSSKIILAAMIVHNFCIDTATEKKKEVVSVVEIREHGRSFEDWYSEGRRGLMEKNHILSRAAREMDRGMAKSETRRGFVALLIELRLSRP